MRKEIILIVGIIAIIVLVYWVRPTIAPVLEEPIEQQESNPQQGENKKEPVGENQTTEQEQRCLEAGGKVSTGLCCNTVSDFPNTCAISSCGCSEKNSYEVKICDCGENKCFNGKECVSLQDKEKKEYDEIGLNTPNSLACTDFFQNEEDFTKIDMSDWETYENRYGYSIKYSLDKNELRYLGVCEDLQELNPDLKCPKKEPTGDPDIVAKSRLMVTKKGYVIPDWWPENRPKEICQYQSPYILISVYSNTAGLSLPEMCKKVENVQKIKCCSGKPNYEIDGVPAIKCSRRCVEPYVLPKTHLDWFSEETQEWIAENDYKPGDIIGCYSSISDSFVILHNGYTYIITTFFEEQDKEQITLFKNILSSFKFTD